jgi:hypothetical protein
MLMLLEAMPQVSHGFFCLLCVCVRRGDQTPQ